MTQPSLMKPRRSKNFSPTQIGLVLFLSLGSLMIVFPFVWMLLGGFKTSAESHAFPPPFFPEHFGWENFTKLFETMPFWQMFWNSIWTSIFIACGNILIGAPAAYAFARLRFPGHGFWFWLHMLSMVIPWQITLIPTFLIVRALGWYDSFTGLIVPSLANAFTVFLLFQFFKSLPRSLEESVLMDGGSWGTALRHVALPAAGGAIAAAWLFSFLGNWQSFIWPFIVLQSEEKMVVSAGLMYLQNQFVVDTPLLMAGSALACVPTIVLYFFVQRYLTDAAVTSGIKA